MLGLITIKSDDMLRIPNMSTMMPVIKYNTLPISFESKIHAILLIKMDMPHEIKPYSAPKMVAPKIAAIAENIKPIRPSMLCDFMR